MELVHIIVPSIRNILTMGGEHIMMDSCPCPFLGLENSCCNLFRPADTGPAIRINLWDFIKDGAVPTEEHSGQFKFKSNSPDEREILKQAIESFKKGNWKIIDGGD